MTARDSQGRFVAGAGARFSDRDNGLQELKRRVLGFANPKISVGILEADGAQAKSVPAGEDEAEALTLIEVACINEFGGGDGTDPPARPFVRGWFDGAQEEIRAQLRAAMQGVIARKWTKDQALNRVALWAVGQIQARIAAGIEPANAESTVERKGSSTPLIATGQLRSAISYKVTDG